MEKMYQNYKTLKSVNPIVLIIALILGFFFFMWFIKAVVFKTLSFVAPALFVMALLFNYRVVLGYGMWLWNTLKSNPLYGLGAIALTVLAHPFVALFLVIRAYQLRGQRSEKKPEKDGEYIKYQEVENEDFLDISKEKQKQTKMNEDYGDLI